MAHAVGAGAGDHIVTAQAFFSLINHVPSNLTEAGFDGMEPYKSMKPAVLAELKQTYDHEVRSRT